MFLYLVHEIYLMDKVESSANGTSLLFDLGDDIVAELLGNMLAVLQWNTEAIILGHLLAILLGWETGDDSAGGT